MEILKKNPFYEIGKKGETPYTGVYNVILGAPGLGKTTLLVHLGLLRAWEGHRFIHVSRTNTPDKVAFYYDSVLDELARINQQEAFQLKDALKEKRITLSFLEEGLDLKNLKRTLSNLKSIQYTPCCIMMDGFRVLGPEDCPIFTQALSLFKFEVWITAVELKEGFLEGLDGDYSIYNVVPFGQGLVLEYQRGHGVKEKLTLNPRTLLME